MVHISRAALSPITTADIEQRLQDKQKENWHFKHERDENVTNLDDDSDIPEEPLPIDINLDEGTYIIEIMSI
jgi:hypothetical protein